MKLRLRSVSLNKNTWADNQTEIGRTCDINFIQIDHNTSTTLTSIKLIGIANLLYESIMCCAYILVLFLYDEIEFYSRPCNMVLLKSGISRMDRLHVPSLHAAGAVE